MKARRDFKYEKATTPVFDKEMGERLRIARMKQAMTQRQLAMRLTDLGCPCTQSRITDLERGVSRHGDFSLYQLVAALGWDLVDYVVLSQGADKIDAFRIARGFIKEVRKKKPGQKKRGNPHNPASYRAVVDRNRMEAIAITPMGETKPGSDNRSYVGKAKTQNSNPITDKEDRPKKWLKGCV